MSLLAKALPMGAENPFRMAQLDKNMTFERIINEATNTTIDQRRQEMKKHMDEFQRNELLEMYANRHKAAASTKVPITDEPLTEEQNRDKLPAKPKPRKPKKKLGNPHKRGSGKRHNGEPINDNSYDQ